MMLDWDGYRQELLKRIGDLGRADSRDGSRVPRTE